VCGLTYRLYDCGAPSEIHERSWCRVLASWTKTEVLGDSSSLCCRKSQKKEEEISEKDGREGIQESEMRVE
jgi:hypothetical protein